MESLKGVLTELNLRIKSPIFSSFIFAWIIINWRIVVLTIHFLTASDSGLSFNQYCVKTQELFNAIKCFWLPLISMLIYIFIIPLFKILVSFVQAKFKKWNFEAEIRGAKDGNVSINTYLGLRGSRCAQQVAPKTSPQPVGSIASTGGGGSSAVRTAPSTCSVRTSASRSKPGRAT